MKALLFSALFLFSSFALAEKAVFAAGCFWSAEKKFDGLAGVESAVSGFTGGTTLNPTYAQVSHGSTGHFEAVEVTFDPKKISYEKLLDAYWHSIDPTDAGGTFCDRGDEYKSAIFVLNDAQKAAAEKSKSEIASLPRFKGKTIATEIKKGSQFYAAEEYHQDYSKKNPLRYNGYRLGCGRDQALEKVWGKDGQH